MRQLVSTGENHDSARPRPVRFWVITTGAESERGIDGGMSRRSEGASNSNTIGVPSIDDALARVTKAGGTVVRPKGPIPASDGSRPARTPKATKFGIMEPDSAAK